MIGQDGQVTEAEKETLRKYKDSDFFRIARKVIGQQWRYSAGQLMRTSREDLQTVQGKLIGLENAYNALAAVVESPSAIPDVPKQEQSNE